MSALALGEAVDVFLGEYIRTTRLTYERDLRQVMAYISPQLPLSAVTPLDVLRAVQQYEQRESVKSPHTVNKIIKTVRVFFHWAERLGLVAEAPLKGLKDRPTAKGEGVGIKKMMPNQMFNRAVKFYRDIAELKPRYARALALFLWLGDGGARRGGAVNLRWRDVDFAKQTAVITEKGQKTRKVWFGVSTKAALLRWRLAQKATKGDFVFSPNGAQITAACLAQYFRRRCVEAGIGGWGPHSLRHRFGVRLRENKTPSHVAAMVMGISLKTYEGHYGEPDEEALKKAALEVAFGSDSLETKSPPEIVLKNIARLKS